MTGNFTLVNELAKRYVRLYSAYPSKAHNTAFSYAFLTNFVDRFGDAVDNSLYTEEHNEGYTEKKIFSAANFIPKAYSRLTKKYDDIAERIILMRGREGKIISKLKPIEHSLLIHFRNLNPLLKKGKFEWIVSNKPQEIAGNKQINLEEKVKAVNYIL